MGGRCPGGYGRDVPMYCSIARGARISRCFWRREGSLYVPPSGQCSPGANVSGGSGGRLSRVTYLDADLAQVPERSRDGGHGCGCEVIGQ